MFFSALYNIKGLFPRVFLSLLLLAGATAAGAQQINVAVASNFVSTLRDLAGRFEQKTGHRVRVSSASTGKLYTQIVHGAPFDLFLAADTVRPQRLVDEGLGVDDSLRTYAMGKLVLLSNLKTDGECRFVLDSPSLKKLAIANPKTAPYGEAARQVLDNLDRWYTVRSKLVQGENIAQTLQFVSTGSAQAGFVAKSMIRNDVDKNAACQWDVPADLYRPIRQDLVLLPGSLENRAAREFWEYLSSQEALGIIRQHGYDVP